MRFESCFRVYPSIKESYMDHSAYLMSPEKSLRHGTLFALEPTNYRALAEGLQRGGYSTKSEYAASLIRTTLLDILIMIGYQTFQVFETWKVYAYPELKMSSSMVRTIELLRLYELDQKVIMEIRLKRP